MKNDYFNREINDKRFNKAKSIVFNGIIFKSLTLLTSARKKAYFKTHGRKIQFSQGRAIQWEGVNIF